MVASIKKMRYKLDIKNKAVVYYTDSQLSFMGTYYQNMINKLYKQFPNTSKKRRRLTTGFLMSLTLANYAGTN